MFRRLASAASSWLAARDDHHYLGRYSIVKLQAFDTYQRSASCMRVFFVIMFTPLPTLIALMAMDVVPMNAPSAGPSKNAVAFVRSTVSHAVMTFFTLLPLKQALSLSRRSYSFRTIACIACCTALTVEALCIPLAFAWRFPVPLREMIGLPVWMTSVCVYNYVFAKRTMRRLWRRQKLQLYVPIAGVQVTLFYVFLGLSVGFAYLALLPQTVMVLTFPLVKFTLKQIVWKYARELDDISTDVSICMLEVSGSLYQTVCLQFVTSHVLSVLILVSDFVQAFHEVRSYLKMDYLGDGQRTLATAITIIESVTQGEHDDADDAKKDIDTTTQASTWQTTIAMPSEWDSSTPIADDATSTTALSDASVSVVAMRRPYIRQASMESVRGKPFTRQSSIESLRSLGFTRQSSTESLRSTMHHRSSDDDAASGRHPRRASWLELRGNSVFVHPTNVRRAGATLRRRATRRLLDLDRLATDPPLVRVGSDCRSDTPTDEPTDKAQQVATAPKVRGTAVPGGIHVGALLPRILLGKPRAGAAMPRSSKVYALNDDAAAAAAMCDAASATVKLSPRTDAKKNEESFGARRLPSRNDPLRFTDLASPLASARTAQPTSARSTMLRRRARGIRIDGIVIARRHQARVLEQTLQLLFVCEVLLFAEYMEVVIPVLYSLTIAGEWASPNAAYNVVVSAMTGEQALEQVWSSLLYALLELASLLVMFYAMKRKYGVSAFYQLAFVLEKYWMTLQGKLLGAFIVVLNAVTVHQGADVFAQL